MPRRDKRERVEHNLYRVGQSYWACATRPGSRQAQWEKLGPIGLMAARRARDEFVARVRRGDVATPGERATFAEVAEAWLEHQGQLLRIDELAPRTYEAYESAVRLHLKPAFGSRQVRSIRPEDLVNWHQDQRAAGASAWSIRARWSPLVGILNYAARHLDGVTNPAERLTRRERPKSGDARTRHLSDDEIKLLLTCAPTRYRTAIATALFTGARVNELLGLVWDDIDFERGVIRVRHQMTRAGKRTRLKTAAARRDIVLMSTLATSLREHRLASSHSHGGHLVFCTARGTTIGARNLAQRGLDKATGKAELSEVSFHVLRHTFASILIAQGRDVAFVSQQLGHTDPGFTLRTYIHLFNAAKQSHAARERLDADYGRLLSDHRR